MSVCKWERSWVGQCEKEAPDGDYCAEHTQKCCSCGEPATHDCGETGQFVCGFPLCDNCEHATFPDGTNGGVGFNQQRLPAGELAKRHVPKAEQKYTPWYTREAARKHISPDAERHPA